MFSLGTIDPLLVETFAGFDVPSSRQVIGLLGDGTSTTDEVIQQGNTPFARAPITGILTSAADLATFKGYYGTGETVAFTDGNGNVTDVRVLELTHEDFTDWWTFSATLIVSDTAVGS